MHKIAVIGGGSTYSPELMEGLIDRAAELRIGEVVSHDTDSRRLGVVGSLCARMCRAAGDPFKFALTTDPRKAVCGAGVIFTQIRVGGQQARILDEKTGMKFGLVGQETTGVGGFAKALRTIPAVLSICRLVEKLAPRAWMINFTNPSGIVTEAVLRHSGVRCIGLCNIPVNLRIDIASALGVAPESVSPDYVGLNHLAWVRRVFVDGQDVSRRLFDSRLTPHASRLRGRPANIPDMDYPPALLRALGMFPAYYNRYYYMEESMKRLARRKKLTRGEEVLAIERRLLEMYANPKLNRKPAVLSKRGGAYYSKAALDVASALLNDSNDTQIVNVQNHGAIECFRDDAVVEVPCKVGKTGAKPIRIGDVGPHILGLMHHVKAYEQLTIEAALTRSYDKALLALLTHPLAGGAEKAPRVLDELNRVHRLRLR
ncbi:MAG: 6-phospho-beta-glucosidase [Deltaproteobacteria bacterium]|nr:6-phospho-beta-glucosidase [Deltaproteobacteria bacterium]